MNENIKQAFPAAQLGPGLKGEIAGRSATMAAGIRRRRQVRRTVIGGLATTTLIVGGVLVGPAAYAVYRLNQIAGSLADVRSMVRLDFDVDANGKETPRGRSVYADGKWRIEKKGRLQIFESGVLWAYDPKLNQVLKHTKPQGPFAYNPSGASVKSMMQDITTWKWSSRPSVGTATLDGQQVTKVTLDERNDVMVVYADPKTDLPIYFEAYRKENGGLTLYGVSKPKFDVKVDPKEFVRNFPATAKVIDVEKIKTDWAAKVEKPVATLQFQRGTIAIRDYAVNERGHVFVVYSNGETAADRAAYESKVRTRTPRTDYEGLQVHIEPKDSIDTQYIEAGGLQPYMGGFGGKPSEWVALRDGQIMHGRWFCPADNPTFRPSRITLTFSDGKRESKTWTIDARQPTHKLIPEWFRALAQAPHSPESLMDSENGARRRRYYTASNWRKFIPLAHEEIKRLDAFAADQRRRITKMDVYYSLYIAHKELGELKESRRWLVLAAKEPEAHYDSAMIWTSRQIIQETLNREGLK